MTVFNYFVLLSTLSVWQTRAFWWPATTTETPSTTTTTTVLKQIPLTYFRTYTYQPIAGHPFAFPFGFGFGAAQTPLLGSARYDPYASSYPPLDASLGHLSNVGAATAASTTTSSPTPPSTTTTTTTSTTTTTTPAPTTTPSPPPPPPTTTSATTPTVTTTPPKALPTAVELSMSMPTPQFPAYNRRMYTSHANNAYGGGYGGVGGGYYTRQQYPFPDYYGYQQPTPLLSPPLPSPLRQQAGATKIGGTRIQFVPCMCPVSLSLTTANAPTGVGVGVGGLPIPSAGLPLLSLTEGTVQARNADADDGDDIDADFDVDNDHDDNDHSDNDVHDDRRHDRVGHGDVIADAMVERKRDFLLSLRAADPPKPSPPLPLAYPVPSSLTNPNATPTYKTLLSSSSSSSSSTSSSLSSTTSGAASSTLSKIIIEALPAPTAEPVERTEAQGPPQDIIVLSAAVDRNESSR